MVDKYSSFESLAAENKLGDDYVITKRHGTRVCIIAPHGGSIEMMTSEIARKVAGNNLGLYLFEGKKPSGNRNLHLTSHLFDEPCFLDFIGDYQVALGVHGRNDVATVEGKEIDDKERIYIGGLNKELKDSLSQSLTKAGFSTLCEGHKFSATHPKNVCNRTSDKGAQIELPNSLRLKVKEDIQLFERLIGSLQEALNLT